jgi:hypothetical protein
MSGSTGSRFEMTWYYVTLFVIVLVISAPFILVLAGLSFGAEQTLGRLGAVLMPAVPVGMVALLVWLVTLIVNGVLRSRRQRGL